MFTMTLEESKLIQENYQQRAQAWRDRQKLNPPKSFREITLLTLADLLITSGNQLKNRLQPA